MFLLACGGGGLLLLLFLLSVAIPMLLIKIPGYYWVACSLVNAHPELGRSAARLLALRLLLCPAALTLSIGAAMWGRSLTLALACLVGGRVATWLYYGRLFITPHVPLTTWEQLGWAGVGMLWSFLLDAAAALFVWGLWAAIVWS